MPNWNPIMARSEFASFGGVGVLLAIGLILALRLLLPKSDRRKIRLPVALLLLNLILVLLRTVVPADSPAQRVLSVSAVFSLLMCIGRAGFLFGVDWLLGKRLARPISKIFRDIIQVFVYIGVGLLTLRAMGVDPGSLLTTSALLTAVIGLSLQETLGNLFAGLAIQAERPFEVGDWIQFESDSTLIGRVTEINWRATKVLTNDMVEVIVPNGILAKAPIRNYTQPTKVSRRTVLVQGPYETPPRLVCRVLLQAIRGAEGVLAHPAPEVLVSEFADSGIEYRVQYFIERFDRRYPIDSDVRSRIWYAFQRAGIGIPFPVRDVRMTDVTARQAQTSVADLATTRELRKVDFLKVVPDELLQHLASRVDIMAYMTGEDIIHQGDEGKELFIILSGTVAVLVGQNGATEQVAELGSGKVFGEMSLMTGERRTTTVRATSECELLVVGHEAFREVLAQAPELAEEISKILARRQAQLEERSVPSEQSTSEEAARGRVLLNRIKEFFSI